MHVGRCPGWRRYGRHQEVLGMKLRQLRLTLHVVVTATIALNVSGCGGEDDDTPDGSVTPSADLSMQPAPGDMSGAVADMTRGADLLSMPASDGGVSNVIVEPGYQIKVWAKGTATYYNPDSVDFDGTHIWIGYQNTTAKDGTDSKTSTVVEYTLDGQVLNSWPVPGHCDGLRIDPATKLAWASSNEDGNPRLVSIDPAGTTVKAYQIPMPTVHGGGFDDMAFVNGSMFISASNPTLNNAMVNVFPAVDKVTFAGTNVVLTPVLMGNATATDLTTQMTTTLNEIDPDSMTIDPTGQLVLVNQAGSELVFIKNPGAGNQAVTRLPVGTQLDDTVWATAAKGRLLLVDAKANTIYSITTKFTPGTIYAETPDDSGINSLLGTVDPATGNITPVAIGFGKATGLLFLAQ
jgi:hypothetical protein